MLNFLFKQKTEVDQKPQMVSFYQKCIDPASLVFDIGANADNRIGIFFCCIGESFSLSSDGWLSFADFLSIAKEKPFYNSLFGDIYIQFSK